MKDILEKLISMLDDIPCTCDNAYKERELTDPNCPRCEWVDEQIIKEAKKQVLNLPEPDFEMIHGDD